MWNVVQLKHVAYNLTQSNLATKNYSKIEVHA